MKTRCSWVNLNNPLSVAYHDNEWGKPCYDDNKLFEMLILEMAQAGLSWHTILNKRENYRIAFDDFKPEVVALYDALKIAELIHNKGIVRHKGKIESSVKNARVFLEIQKAYGSFSNYIWSFTQGQIISSAYDDYNEAPSKTALSDEISKSLKEKGMRFVGSTIIYAYMQAIGMVNEHQRNCCCKVL